MVHCLSVVCVYQARDPGLSSENIHLPSEQVAVLLLFVGLFFEIGSCYVAQTGFELVAIPCLSILSDGIIGTSFHTQLGVLES